MAHNVNLSWQASTDSSVTGYNVYRGGAAGAESTLLTATPVAATTFDDTTESAGSWFYIVKSVAFGIESLASNEVTVVLRPSAPTNLVVVSFN